MKKFIYVFSEEDCQKLLSLSYTLLKFNRLRKIYIFENSIASDPIPAPVPPDVDAVFTDTLIFWSEKETETGSDVNMGLH